MANTDLYDKFFGEPKDEEVVEEIASESTSLYDKYFGEPAKAGEVESTPASKEITPVIEPPDPVISDPAKVEAEPEGKKSFFENALDMTESNLGIGEMDTSETRPSLFAPKPQEARWIKPEGPKPESFIKGTTKSLYNQLGLETADYSMEQESFDKTPEEPLNVASEKAGQISSAALTIMGDTVDALGTMAKDPLGVAGGAARVGAILNPLTIGVAMAAGTGAFVGEAINQVAFYDLPEWSEYVEERPYTVADPVAYMFSGFNLEEMYDRFIEGFSLALEGAHAVTEPSIEMLTGPERKASELTQETAFAPFTAGQMPFHALAGHEWFADSPNLRGVLKVTGDIVGAAGMGLAMHGGKKTPMDSIPEGYVDRLPTNVREVRDISKEIETLIAKKSEVEKVPDEVVRRAEEAALEIQKKQLELRAQEAAKSISIDATIREELLRNSERIALEKAMPVANSGLKKATEAQVRNVMERLPEGAEIEAEFTAKKSGNRYVKSEGKWYDKDGKVVTNGWIIKSAEKGKKGVEKVEVEAPAEVKVEEKPVEEIKVEEKPAEKPLVEEPVVEEGKVHISKVSDPVPDTVKGEQSPFFQDRKTAIVQKKIFDEKRKIEDVEIFTQKLISEANQWFHGLGEVKIEDVKAGLDKLVQRADDYNHHFISTRDYAIWRETVTDAAAWVRTLDRYEKNQSGSSSPRKPGKGKDGGPVFGMMILPVDKMPKAVADILKGSKELVKSFAAAKVLGVPYGEIYRNKKIYNETGYWLGKDGKWRHILKSNKMKVNAERLKTGKNLLLRDVLDYPELYKEVPELEYVRIKLDRNMKGHGNYSHIDNTITVKNPHDMYVVLHETSHALSKVRKTFQGSTSDIEYREIVTRHFKTLEKLAKTDVGRENIATLRKWLDTTGNVELASKIAYRDVLKSAKEYGLEEKNLRIFEVPIKSYERYLQVPGEMEARLAERLSKMTEAQLEKTPPWEVLERMLKEEQLNQDVKYSPRASYKLYSGVPIPEMKEVFEMCKDVSNYFTKARHHKRLNFFGKTKELKREGVRAFINTSGNLRQDLLKIRDAGWELLQLHTLAKNANSKAVGVFDRMFKVLDSGLSKRERDIRDNLIFTNRVLDIASYKTPKQFKILQEIDPMKFAMYKEGFEFFEGLSPKKAARVRESANDYFSFMKEALADMYDSGLITEEKFNSLVTHNYSRMELADNIDEFRYVTVGGKQVKVYDSGIQALKSGEATDMFETSSRILAFETLSRAYGRIEKNKLNKRIAQLAIDNPDNPIARVKMEIKSVVNGKEVVKKTKIPKGWKGVDYFENGERKTVHLHPEIYKEWVMSAEHMSNQFAKFLELASGTRALKTFATGIEASFALVNMPWDVMRTMWSARRFKDGKWEAEYNPVLPIGIGQELYGIGRVSMDVIRRKGIYQEWVNEAAKPNFLAIQGRMFRKGKYLGGPADKINNTLGYIGETSEALTRVGIYDHHIRKVANERGISYEEARKDPGIRREAAFISLDNTNFGEYGYIMGGLNNVSPYLTAGVVGNRAFYRAFKPNEGTAAVSAFKLAQFSAAIIGTYAVAKELSPKTMDQLQDDPNMERVLAIPLGDAFGFEDQYGQMRYPYFKIPIPHEMRVFKAASEGAYDKVVGNPVNVERIVEAGKNINPVGSPLPPTVEAYLGYVSNKDFWRNEDIVNQKFPYPLSKDEGYPNQTSNVFKDVAKKTGLSGPRSEHFVESLLTSNSMWLWMGGKAYEKLLMDLPKDQYKYHWAEIASKTPGLSRYIGITNPYNKSRKNIDQEKLLAEHKRHVENTMLDSVVEGYLYRGTDTKKDVIDYIRQFKDEKVQKRLYDRFAFQQALSKTQDMDLMNNRTFWLRMQNITDAEARAKVFVNEVENSLPERAEELKRELGLINSMENAKVPNFRVVSEPFIQAYVQIMSEKIKAEREAEGE